MERYVDCKTFEIVEAIQITLENYGTVSLEMGANATETTFNWESKEFQGLFTLDGEAMRLLYKMGSWVIRHDGQLGIMEDVDFQEQYDPYTEPAEEPEWVPADGEFARDLAALLNRYSAESISGTPDFILAEVMIDALKAFNENVSKRAEWRGENVSFEPGDKFIRDSQATTR